jgi:hypothetical protein
MSALPNLVPAGILLPAKVFSNARLTFLWENLLEKVMFCLQNVCFSDNFFPQ